jgi:hypothetical protein
LCQEPLKSVSFSVKVEAGSDASKGRLQERNIIRINIQ